MVVNVETSSSVEAS